MKKVTALLLCLSLFSSLLLAADGRGVRFPMKYEGGSAPLNPKDKLEVFVSSDAIRFVQKKQTIEVPVKSVTEISYGNDVHRRVGAAIGVGVVTLGIGALMALVKTKKHYVGLTWNNEGESKGGVVFKVGKGEYRGFLAALEGVTGLQAVNADEVGSGGTSKP